ncbi:MAG: YlxR family protein [Clostridia bacterium]|nr:YlxR family protein [Clostridia bacterium]
MPKPRKIPQRMCVGCRSRNDKRNLIRVVRTPAHEVIVDPTGKRAGRGAYICPRLECLRKAVKSRALERALNVTITADILGCLEDSLSDNHENR